MGDETDSAFNTIPVFDTEQVPVDLGLLADRKATNLANALERFADKLIDLRGLTGRFAGIDAYQAMLCAVFENDRRCVDRKSEFRSTAHWLFWLIGRCVDDYGRHPEPPLGDSVVDLPSDDDVEKQVDNERRLEAFLDAVSRTEFAELIKVIHFRDDHQTLAETIGMDTKSLRKLLKRFDYFVKNYRS